MLDRNRNIYLRITRPCISYRIKHCFLGNYLCIYSGSSLTNWIKSERLDVQFVSELLEFIHTKFPNNTVFNPYNFYNSYSWTSCLLSTLNTIKEIPKESLKQWTCNTHTIASKLKEIREMLLTTLEHNQHDVIDFQFET